MRVNSLFLATGFFVGVFGILLILAPRAVIKIERLTDRIVETDTQIMSRRLLCGALLILAGIHMIYVYVTR